MALQIKNNFVKEDIVDENGNKLGELKFNPNDSRIMKSLTEIINYSSEALKEVDKLDDIKMPDNELKTIEDFEKSAEYFSILDKGFDIEISVTEKIIDKLSEIFGRDTIELFTNGTKDADTLIPVIDFIAPYVKKARKGKVGKYLDNAKESTTTDVME